MPCSRDKDAWYSMMKGRYPYLEDDPSKFWVDWGSRMRRMFHRLMQFSQKHRAGAATLEFTIVLPLFFLLCLVIWQLIVVGMAIMDTQAALRDAVKLAATSGDTKKAIEQGKSSFGTSNQYELTSLKVEIKDNKVHASAKTKIPVLFTSALPYTYENTAEAPVVQNDQGAFLARGIEGPLLSSGGILGPPLRNMRITSKFGYRIDPVYGGGAFHGGLDFGAPAGTPIYAAESGTVIRSGPAGGYGNVIVIDHGNGLLTLYAHMYSHGIFVRAGDTVKRGDPIGAVGSAGKSTGPHLHFEVHVGTYGNRVNPLPYLQGATVASR